jgi:hypothetical protein
MAFRLAPAGLPNLLRPAPSKVMFTRPSRRVESVAESQGAHSGYLIRCDGLLRSGEPCGRHIVLKPAEKTVCPFCERVFSRGYLGVVTPLTVVKAP